MAELGALVLAAFIQWRLAVAWISSVFIPAFATEISKIAFDEAQRSATAPNGWLCRNEHHEKPSGICIPIPHDAFQSVPGHSVRILPVRLPVSEVGKSPTPRILVPQGSLGNDVETGKRW